MKIKTAIFTILLLIPVIFSVSNSNSQHINQLPSAPIGTISTSLLLKDSDETTLAIIQKGNIDLNALNFSVPTTPMAAFDTAPTGMIADEKQNEEM